MKYLSQFFCIAMIFFAFSVLAISNDNFEQGSNLNIAPAINLLLMGENAVLTENWHLVTSDGLGTGDIEIKRDSSGKITSSGNIIYPTPYGFDITMSFQGASVSGSDGEYDSVATGIASSPFGTSDFKTTTHGVVSQGYGTGQNETEYFSPGWPAKTTGSFLMTRIDGSGITPETGTVDISEGSDDQYLYCLSDCSRMGWVLTNVSKEPTTILNRQSCSSVYNEFGRAITTCTGEIEVVSTGITYNSSTIYNYETCRITVDVIGIGSCQTN